MDTWILVVGGLLLCAVEEFRRIYVLKETRNMAAIDDLKAASAALITKTDALIATVTAQGAQIAGLTAQVAELQAQLAAAGVDLAAIAQVTHDLNAEADKVTAATPPPPAPTPAQ